MSDIGADVDVIVLDLDGGFLLRDCLVSVSAQTLPPLRVIVFDNGSKTPVETATPAITVVRSEVNLGFAGGVNAALRHSDAPFVALVNNDVVLDADWLATVREAMFDETLGAVQTVIRRDEKTVDGAGISVSDGTIRQIAHGAPLDSPRSPLAAPRPPVWGLSATATLYRRELLHFDERFFAYYEDAELSARLREGGWGLSVLPVARVTHRGSQSASRLAGDALRLRTRNRYWVARLHPGTARIGALLWEDARLAFRGRTSLRGIIQGMFGRLRTKVEDEG
jgi:GT2 family glycosyltransferase